MPLWTPCGICGGPLHALDHDKGCPVEPEALTRPQLVRRVKELQAKIKLLEEDLDEIYETYDALYRSTLK